MDGKECSICEEFKPYSDYRKRAALKDGHRSACEECEKEKRQTIYRDKIIANSTRHNRLRGHTPLDQYREMRKQNKIPQSTRVARRRAQKLNATPLWADRVENDYVYHAARVIQEIYGTIWEVDHVIPLIHDKVCGLHVANNLQLLSPIDNRRKSNKFEAA